MDGVPCVVFVGVALSRGGVPACGLVVSVRVGVSGARTPNEREAIQRQIAATDGRIDQLVYELYGLTADEIKIVEGATP